MEIIGTTTFVLMIFFASTMFGYDLAIKQAKYQEENKGD